QRAAHAPAGQDDRALVDPAHEVVVDRDLAELVDEHRGLPHVRVREQRRDQRRLAAPEEAGDEDDREAVAHDDGRWSAATPAGSAPTPARTRPTTSRAACSPARLAARGSSSSSSATT